MDSVIHAINDNNKIKENTKNKLLSNFKNITKGLNDNNFKEKLNDINFIENYINKQKALSTKATILSGLMSINNKYKEKYNQDLLNNINSIEELFKLYKNKNETERSKQDNKKFIEWDTLLKIRDSYNENSNDYLYFALYTMIPPRRRDYLNINEDKTISYTIFVNELPETLDNETNYIVLGDYITFNFFNKKERKGLNTRYTCTLKNDNFEYLDKIPSLNPEKLNTIIKNSYNNKPRKYLFENSSSILKKYKHNDIQITANVFRHSFSTMCNKLNLSDYYYKLIVYNFGDTDIQTFKSYRNCYYNETETETESETESNKGLIIATDAELDIEYINDMAANIQINNYYDKLNDIKLQTLKEIEEYKKLIDEKIKKLNDIETAIKVHNMINNLT